jgi:hypothetical protein
LEGRGSTARERVVTRWVGRVTITGVERVVIVVSGHDKVASHFVEGVEALEGGRCFFASSNADSEANLVVGNEVHPLFVKDVGTSDVGSDVSSDGVTQVGSSVGVELTTFVAGLHSNLGEVSQGHDLEVQGCLYKVNSGERSIGNDTSVISGLCAVGNSDCFYVGNDLSVGRGEGAPIINRVDGNQSRDRCLIDRGAQAWCTGISRTICVSGHDTKVRAAGSTILELGSYRGRQGGNCTGKRYEARRCKLHLE